MGTRVFLIGATGHIGGAVLDNLLATHPCLPVTVLVRSEHDAKLLKDQYPEHTTTVDTVVDSLETINSVNEVVDSSSIVINCAPDATHGKDMTALLETLASSITTPNPKFYIGTTGAALIWDAPTGSPTARTWDDISDIDDIISQPESITHAVTDRLIRSAKNLNPLLHTALISPAFVTGVSPSVKRPTPLIFPDWLHVVKTLAAGVVINGGENRTSFVDVKRLARLYVHLVEDALERLSSSSPTENLNGTTNGQAAQKNGPTEIETWGPKAYYFGASLEISFLSFLEKLLIPALWRHAPRSFLAAWSEDGGTPAILNLDSVKQVTDIIMQRHQGEPGGDLWSGHIAEGMGVNMRVRGRRAEEVFGGRGFTWAVEGDELGDAGIGEAVRVWFELQGGREGGGEGL